MEYVYELDFKVRDYECDLQGIVNNSVYQNYLEHTRHEFIKTKGFDFAELHNEGIDCVVARVEMEFKNSLKSGDEFAVRLNVKKEGRVKIVFYQDVYRKTDNKLMLKGRVTSVCIVNGKLSAPEEMERLWS